jgi:hypothetical protein
MVEPPEDEHPAGIYALPRWRDQDSAEPAQQHPWRSFNTAGIGGCAAAY